MARAGRSSPSPSPAGRFEKDRAILGRIFGIFERLGYRDGNPVRATEAPRYDKRDPVILSEAEYEALLTACEARNPFLHRTPWSWARRGSGAILRRSGCAGRT